MIFSTLSSDVYRRQHNNWSLCTDTGINLFSPAKTAEGNMLFLTFIVNVLMMVYKNQDLLRASIVSAGNSHRLGANEAPPAILSIFLGRHLCLLYTSCVCVERLQVVQVCKFPPCIIS